MQTIAGLRAQTTRTVLAVLAMLLLALLIYWPGLSGPFVLDDMQNIVGVHLDHMDWNAFVYTITHNTSGMLGRIVSICSFALSGVQFGLDPWGYKFENLLLHLCNGLMLLRLLYLTLQQLVPTDRRNQQLLCALLVTAFWLLHPLQVSTVLYVVQRMTILSTLFMLAALLCYLAARKQPEGSPRYWLLAFVCYPLLQLLAVFSKENGALLPLFILVYEALVFRSLRAPRLIPHRHQLFLLGAVFLPLFAGGLYLLSHFSSMIDYSTRNFTLAERLLSQLHVIPFYLKLMLLPRIRDMSLFHDDFPLTTTLDPLTVLLLVLLLGMVAAIWLLRRKLPVLAFGLAWFLVSHMLESTIIPLELVFEHRNYLALAGILLPVIYLVSTYKEQKLALAVLGLFALVFLVQTFARVQEWSNEELMDGRAVADHPDSVRARTTMANLLTIQRKFAEAQAQLEAAVRIDPQDAGPLLHELTILCAQGVSSPPLVEKTAQVLAAYPATVYAMNAFEQLYSRINSDECKLVSQADMARLVDAAQSQVGNNNNQLIKGYLFRLKGFQALLAGDYAPGVVFMHLGYEASRDIVILVELAESQINYRQLGDAQDTLDMIRDINRQHRGIDTYQVERLEALLQQAKSGKVPEHQRAIAPINAADNTSLK
ncbi:MAG: hypothetical protein WCI66_11495 [Gammaproteobacteria bacterium]